jgi:hypothetical protein
MHISRVKLLLIATRIYCHTSTLLLHFQAFEFLEDRSKVLNPPLQKRKRYLRARCRPEIQGQERTRVDWSTKNKRLYIHGVRRPAVDRNQIDDRNLHLAETRALGGSLCSGSLRYWWSWTRSIMNVLRVEMLWTTPKAQFIWKEQG